jgi:hypothetical protein
VLVGDFGEWEETAARASGQDDTLHKYVKIANLLGYRTGF